MSNLSFEHSFMKRWDTWVCTW